MVKVLAVVLIGEVRHLRVSSHCERAQLALGDLLGGVVANAKTPSQIGLGYVRHERVVVLEMTRGIMTTLHVSSHR